MTHLIRQHIMTVLAIVVLLLVPLAFGELAHAQLASDQATCESLKEFNPDDKGCGAADGGVNKIIKVTIDLLSIIGAIIAVIMIIVSGLKFITSQGDAAKAASSRQTLIYAIVGLVIVAAAQVIVRFTLGNL